ncbi:MAG: T9SS type A sorting domain-containing protein [Saprospiraceae bacterium]|nr:T9SS type A sorting domain-containing protein [Saprospiraceae bacterium]
MKRIYLNLFLLFIIPTFLKAQSTGLRVYEIMQEKCATCHNHADPQGGLDLEGAGANTSTKFADVYGNIVGQIPANEIAAENGDHYIYKGRADRSFLFRKINANLDETITLKEGEGQSMPAYGGGVLTEVETELIRQWILFGAPTSGTVVDESLLETYYSGMGQTSFPDGPPEAPAAEEGFQIKMGPFFLEPGGEVEFFTKYELDLPEDVEVTRLDVKFSNYSHHFIMYDFPNGNPSYIPEGLRLEADHSDISLVAAVQEPLDLNLPEGTAFFWDNDRVLDLNSHYINYSATLPYQAEVYVNVYTQEQGIAAQEMKTELLVNPSIYIPNNGNEITHTQQVTYNLGEVFLWGMMGHTHQYGTDYKVYKRLAGGVKGDLIYDASCALGIPGCVSPYFDYHHIPMRYFSPLEPITMNFFNGIIHEAKWVNNGPSPVNFGPTSDDEMMVLVLMYLEDTTGVVTNLETIPNPLSEVEVFPNPMDEKTVISIPTGLDGIRFRLFDTQGRELRTLTASKGSTQLEFNRQQLPSGMYFYRIEDESGRFQSGKLMIN